MLNKKIGYIKINVKKYLRTNAIGLSSKETN